MKRKHSPDRFTNLPTITSSSNGPCLQCPICLDILKTPYLTRCSHNICHECLLNTPKCPICSIRLTENDYFPNVLLGQVIQKQFSLTNQSNSKLLSNVEESNVDSNVEETQGSIGLLYSFLKSSIIRKETIIKQTCNQLETAQKDLDSLRAFDLDSKDIPNTHKLLPHMQDLESEYYKFANKQVTLESDLKEFTRNLSSITKYTKLQTLATLYYADNFFNFSSSIVSSMEFDKDDEFFATAGVTRKIRIYAYADVIRDYRNWRDNFITSNSMTTNQEDDGHVQDGVVQTPTPGNTDSVPRYPLLEMSCHSKISCLSWNTQVKSYLASADYEGCISLWDTNTATMVTQYDEHEKRAWSVDFCESDPSRLASGGDDSKVKLWSIHQSQKRAVLTIDAKANVCSVKFHPTESHSLAFGSADHYIHYYDLRNPKMPLFTFKGHKKAASYVRFLNSNQFISASTDCSLKSWLIEESIEKDESEIVKTYTGHVNEKNFVGLSVNSTSDFIACGSETNEVYIYHSKLAAPILSLKFGNNADLLSGQDGVDEDPSQFVSSLCFKKNQPNILLAANSQGRIKVLEMV